MFCPRQAALIHVEQVWRDNARTIEGSHMHEIVHGGEGETRADVRIARGLPLRSLRLGLSGQADVVEFRRIQAEAGVSLAGRRGAWHPIPVEYKRGRPKKSDCDRVQLCAQALCLEEMLGVEIAEGLLYYGQTKRRVDVTFDDRLRLVTAEAARGFRALVDSGQTPLATESVKCPECSLFEACRPGAAEKSAARYLASHLSLVRRSEDLPA